MRKLASIVEIENLSPILWANKIEVALMKGKSWEIVVKKGEFSVGDLAVYFEIDSFLPKKEPFIFLEGRCNKEMYGEEGYLLKTRKIKGQISQGLLLSIDSFEELKDKDIKVGDDVTEILGVKKYEYPLPAKLQGEALGPFPSFIPKTDEERLQNLIEYFEKYKDVEFEATLKLDGTSCTVFKDGVCSRNLQLKEKDGNTYWDVVKKQKILDKIKESNKNIALQGEIIGDGIQKNHCNVRGHEFYLFNIFDIDEQRYLTPSERIELTKELNIQHVPIIKRNWKVFKEFNNFDSLHSWVKEQKGLNETIPEGVVFKSEDLIRKKLISFKIINNNYLLKE